MDLEKNIFSLFPCTFCAFTYFFCIFVPRLFPERIMRDKKLSLETGNKITNKGLLETEN